MDIWSEINISRVMITCMQKFMLWRHEFILFFVSRFMTFRDIFRHMDTFMLHICLNFIYKNKRTSLVIVRYRAEPYKINNHLVKIYIYERYMTTWRTITNIKNNRFKVYITTGFVFVRASHSFWHFGEMSITMFCFSDFIDDDDLFCRWM